MIRAIIFDVAGVLYIEKKDYYTCVRKKLGLSPEEWKNLNRISFRKSWSRGKRVEEGMSRASKKLGITKKELTEAWEKSLGESYVLNKGLIKIIKKLRKNYKTAILSNQWKVTYDYLINKSILKSFDVPVFSHQIGYRKPEKEIYLILLKKLGLEPEECIFIDDQEEALAPAKKMGMRTILFKNNSQVINAFKKQGVIL